ncbi:MAG: NADH:flavin oxidoreductase [Desulfobacteraceae bacterium]|nr:MAG: NADH:flavin oxidoreductase [Desulfobacteraceae bacterium]
MDRMFQTWSMGQIELSNRLVRSATVEGLSTEDGRPTQKLIDKLTELAAGGVGMIIAGTAYISPEGQADKTSTGLHGDHVIQPLRRMCRAVQQANGILAAQLLHCGSTAGAQMLGQKEVLFGPSAMVDPVSKLRVEALSRDHVLKIINDYGKAAARAKKAGFNAVQIHAAHGYLINQFLSRSRNHRNDQYGGSVQNRGRLLYQVYEEIRGAVGHDYPVMIKMSAHDGFTGGVMPEEAAETASTLDALGIDAIEVSAGTPEGACAGGWDHIIPAPFTEGSFFEYAALIKDTVQCPVITVEGWRDPLKIERALESIDAVSMSRPFIREPDLVNRWAGGDLSPAKCTSCNTCLDLISESGLGCIFHEKTEKLKKR